MGYTTVSMADICEELQKQLKVLDGLRELCLSVLVKEGMESDAVKETVRKFDNLAEELRDVVVLYKQPFNERLDDIERKMEDKKNLTKWEYWVLYGIGQHLKSRNYEEEERRREMMKRWRSDEEKKQDLALAFGTTSNRISLTEEEALSGTIRYHYGDLDLGDLTSAEGLTLPEEVGGTLALGNLTSIDTEITMPKELVVWISGESHP